MVHINWTFLKLSFRSLFNYSDLGRMKTRERKIREEIEAKIWLKGKSGWILVRIRYFLSSYQNLISLF